MQARPEDLRSFAENLDINQFKALSPGFGLGELRPKTRVKASDGQRNEGQSTAQNHIRRPSPERLSHQVSDPIQKSSHRAQGNVRSASRDLRAPEGSPRSVGQNDYRFAGHDGEHHVAVNEGGSPRSQGRGWGTLLRVWSLDITLVLLAVAVALSTAALVQGLQEGVSSQGWVDLGVFKFVRSFGPWELAAILAAVFFGYLGLFRGLLGQTLGESMAGCAKNQKDNLGYKANHSNAPL